MEMRNEYSSSEYSEQCLGALQVGDHTAGDAHDVVGVRAEVIVPRAGSGPHLVVLQQVRINRHAQLLGVIEGRHATIGL